MTKVRVAVVNSHPVQYFAPLYAFLNADPSIEVTALYLSDYSLRGARDEGFGTSFAWDVDLLQGYPHQFVGSVTERSPRIGEFFSLVAPEIWCTVRQGGFDALWLHGHSYAAYLIAFAAARSIDLPVLMRAETHLRLSRGPVKRVLRERIMRAFYERCARFLAIGSANAEFYRSLGVPDASIFMMPYVVDNSRFMGAASMSADERSATRKGLAASDQVPLILYASKFQPQKRPQDLIEACAILRDEGHTFDLVMVGSGEMEAALKSLAADLTLRNVSFPGFVNQSALPRVYAAADIFVLPSEQEPWGLVVNEAMCAGLPIVTTDVVGAARDLVRNGGNGFTYRPGDIRGLAAALRPLVVDGTLRQQMGQQSRVIINTWSFEECRVGLKAALASLPRRPRATG
ncbi:MAG: glycosyltransferase family 1 protein [Hyphomicrobiales bacterium]|nr:MAG: glycosyltransferase family 1 protein [Hyphomicrobiales bacterium]